MNLTVQSETATTVTLQWAAISGAVGYVFTRDGTRVSHTMDGGRTSVKFSKPDAAEHSYGVEELVRGESAIFVIPAPIVVPSPAGIHTWTYWASLPGPAFTAARTLVCATRAQFDAAWAAIQPGDLLDVRGVVFSGEVVLSKQPTGLVKVQFDPSCRATGTTPGSRLPAIWVNNSRNIILSGLDVTNPGGVGILIYDGDITWQDAKVHGCANGGIGVFSVTGPAKVDLRAEIWNCGLDLSLDPHQEKGSGLHGAYLADSRGSVSGRVALDVHDQPTGAGVQVGPGGNELMIALRARRMTFDSVVQIGGNALQFWSYGAAHPKNVNVPYLEAADCAGRAVDTNGMGSCENVRVEYGRATNMCLNRLPGNTLDSSPVGRVVWDSRGGITYGDVA